MKKHIQLRPYEVGIKAFHGSSGTSGFKDGNTPTIVRALDVLILERIRGPRITNMLFTLLSTRDYDADSL